MITKAYLSFQHRLTKTELLFVTLLPTQILTYILVFLINVIILIGRFRCMIYYSCCAITYLPRPHTWLAYRKVIIARIVTTYWHIFPEKTQNTLKIWFDSNEAYTGIMSAGQKACNSKTIFFILVWSIFAQGSFF